MKVKEASSNALEYLHLNSSATFLAVPTHCISSFGFHFHCFSNKDLVTYVPLLPKTPGQATSFDHRQLQTPLPFNQLASLHHTMLPASEISQEKCEHS